ncbi:MAG: hypothetical protein HYT21_01575 [Candidatus Nealsonbacteria bacterium]|nr:hypothetical protein [Candidatus Nealsonbacteria bacterium]
MKKIFPILTVVILLALPVFAVNAQQVPPTIFQGPQDVINLITRVTNWLFTAVLVLSAAFLIFAGFKFITAGGSATDVASARTMLINALIGVVVAVAALGLVNVVRTILQ